MPHELLIEHFGRNAEIIYDITQATARRAAEDAVREEREAAERAAAKAEADAAAARQRERKQQKAAAEAAERRRAAESEAAEKLLLAEAEAATARQEASSTAECAAEPEQDWQEAAERQRSAAAAACSPQDHSTAHGLGASRRSSERQQLPSSADSQPHEAERRLREAGAGVDPAAAAASADANGQRHERPGLAQHAQQQSHQPPMQASHSGVSTTGTDDARPRRAWSLDNGHHMAVHGIPESSRWATPLMISGYFSHDRRRMSVCFCTLHTFVIVSSPVVQYFATGPHRGP